MQLGVCYYPEQWPRERWPLDAKLMRQAGISLVRIAEFAWAAMEPGPGQFTWEWLDQAIEALAAESLQVVLGTPTASPPPWLCRAHPDILPVDAEGRRRRHGSRRHYCANSEPYRQHTTRIVTAMASRYGNHPSVVGWQIDNEFGCHGTARCYCETCAAAFRRWLEARYATPEALNDAWGTIFWSQVYGRWDEIDPPNLTVAGPNPSHVLDYYRFCSDSFVAYQQLQLSTLKPLIADQQFVTTNLMSRFTDLNYCELARPLDLVTMSSYPTGHAESSSPLDLQPGLLSAYGYDVGDPYLTSFAYALMRGYKPNRPFWVMEQQCGHVNWGAYNTGIRPGTTRLWTWHALASGAEAVVYFRWRAGLLGQEQLHSGLLHHDASPAVGYADLEAMRADRSLMSQIASEPHQAQIAFLLDFDSLWAVQLQPHHHNFDFMRSLFVCYRALQRLGIPADILASDADLSPYKMVIVLTASLATEKLAASLKAYAEAGGTVLIGVRSGTKTVSNRFTDRPLPGVLRDLLGITVNDWHSLPPGVSYDLRSSLPDLSGRAEVWAEALEPATPPQRLEAPVLQVHASYSSGPFASRAALTEHKVGDGSALYLGWQPSGQQAEAILAHLANQAGVERLAAVPDGLIVSRRGSHVILLNFTDEPLNATVQGRTISIGPRGVNVLTA